MVDAVKQNLEITAARRERQILHRKAPKIAKIELGSESSDSETDSDSDSDTERRRERKLTRSDSRKKTDKVLVLIQSGEIDLDSCSPAHFSALSEKLDRSDLESSADAPDVDKA